MRELNNKKVTIEFTILTFGIAYIISIFLIISSHFGYTVYNWVSSIQEFFSNIPFAIYILSPAIASYSILKKNERISGIKEWLGNVFYLEKNLAPYLYVFILLIIYFSIHFIVSDNKEFALPFYTFFLSLPGNLIIGGLEEAGWMYILQPELDKKYGYIWSSLIVGIIWLFWHIPLFFISGTNHAAGLINFGMFSFQVIAFRFVYGVIYKISDKSGIFMCILFHTLFNALSPIFCGITTTWKGTILANIVLIILSLTTIIINDSQNKSL